MRTIETRIRRLEARRRPPPEPPTPEDLARQAARREHIARLPGGAALLDAMDRAGLASEQPAGILRTLVRPDRERGPQVCGYVWRPVGGGPTLSALEPDPPAVTGDETGPPEA